jgi:uncharacterized phage protein (TIGR01671 family)
MREILFRGKRVDNGEWVYGDLIHYDDMSYKNGSKRVFIVEKDCRLWDILEDGDEVDPATVGQFTGDRTRCGTQIFEGDILYHRGMRDYYVIFENSAFKMISMDRVQRNNWRRHPLHDVADGYEVMGNIHDLSDEHKDNGELQSLVFLGYI